MRREAVEMTLAKQTVTVGVNEARCGRGGAISRIYWCMAAPARVATAHGQCCFDQRERERGGGVKCEA